MRRLGSALVATLLLAPGLSQAQDAHVGDAKAGASNFAKLCAACHGPRALGGEGPDLTQSIYAHGNGDNNVAHSIREGQPGGMPSFRATLSDAEINDLVAFLVERRADPTNPRNAPPKVDTAIPKGVVKTDAASFRVQVLAHVPQGCGFAFLPDGRILVTQNSGALRMIDHGKLLPDPIVGAPTGGVEGKYDQKGRNLIDVIVDPDYKHNGWIYVDTVHPVKNPPPAGTEHPAGLTITRGHIRDGHWVDSQAIIDFSIETPTALRMAFDPQRHLYIGTSWPNFEFVSLEQAPKTPPLLLSSTWGKILRLNADGSVPSDNPFVGKGDANPYVFSYGNRAPLGLVVNRKGEVWETENGPRGGDELNLIQSGHNYGWPASSWGLRYDDVAAQANPEPKGVDQPIINWSPSPSVSSIDFYYGKAFPRWKDNIIMGSLKATDLYRIVLDGDRPVLQEVIIHHLGRVRTVKSGPDGYVYVMTDEGNFVRLVPAH
jgi:glucose/arabinose dehydrogenase